MNPTRIDHLRAQPATGIAASPARRAAVVGSPLGPIALIAAGDALCGLSFDGDPAAAATPPADDPLLRAAARWLAAYFAGDRAAPDFAIAPEGTPFQLRVWALLRQIPFGETTSYGELARTLGDPGASRAVGLANGRNPVGIAIPCHRVIGASGSLVGYAGGIERKRWLLDHERGAPALF